MHIILEPDAELPANVNPRFVAENHIRGESRAVSANQVRPFVAIHAHAVSDAVREIFIVRSIARFGNDLARSGIHAATGLFRVSGFQRRTLGAMNDVEYFFHVVSGFAQNKGPADVGNITLHLASAVDPNDGAFLNRLRLNGTVRDRRVWPDLDIGITRKS